MNVQYTLLIALVLCSCSQPQVVESYKFYDTLDTPGRHFERVVACDPFQRRDLFVSQVNNHRHDENALHLHIVEESRSYYVVILSNGNGFDCGDDKRFGPIEIELYPAFCDSIGIPMLF